MFRVYSLSLMVVVLFCGLTVSQISDTSSSFVEFIDEEPSTLEVTTLQEGLIDNDDTNTSNTTASKVETKLNATKEVSISSLFAYNLTANEGES